MTIRTNRVRIDLEGKDMVDLVCGCVEVGPIGDAYRLIGVAIPYRPVALPRQYNDLQEARADCDSLNSDEHPCSFPDGFRDREHTIATSAALGA